MAKGKEYREGGWGWFVVLACFMAEFVVYGTLKALGVLMKNIQEDLGTDLWIVGSIHALHIGVLYILSPAATLLARKYGGRPVIICGGLLYGLGFVLASTSYNIAVLSIGLIGLAGTGSAGVLQTARGEIVFYFKEKFSVAIFLTFVGTVLGVSVYGPITQIFLDTYGWRGAMLLLGGLGFNLVWAGALMRRPKTHYQGIPNDDIPSDEEDTDDTQPKCFEKTKCSQSLITTLGFNVFYNFDFIVFASIRMFYNISYNGFVVYMVPNALATGLTPKEASFLSTAFGVGSFAGLFLGVFIARLYIQFVHVGVIIVCFVTALLFAVDPIIQLSFISQFVIVFGIGTGIHCVIIISAVLIRTLPFGDDSYGVINGWMAFISGLSSAVGDVFIGWVYDVTQSFFCAFLLLSVFMLGIVVCSIVELFHIYSSKERDKVEVQ